MRHRIETARAEDFLATLPDNSVDLILTAPPYFRVKRSLKWDTCWDDADAFVAWLREVALEWRRVLKPNGTLVCFAGVNPTAARGATLAARVEVMLGELFNVVASVAWHKRNKAGVGPAFRHNRDTLRAWFPEQERAVVCEQGGSDGAHKNANDKLKGFVFEPLRAYLCGERERSGLRGKQIQEGMFLRTGARYVFERHAFSKSQWEMPTQRQYEAFRDLCNAEGDPEGRPYCTRPYHGVQGEGLRAEYERLRAEYERLRRPFNARAGEHFTDVWTYPTVQGFKGKHPCQKPPEMARDLVAQCSRPGGVVLDTFCGSGVFLEAAAAAGRTAWGCDAQERWAIQTAQACAAYANVQPMVRQAAPTPKTAPATATPQTDLIHWLKGAT